MKKQSDKTAAVALANFEALREAIVEDSLVKFKKLLQTKKTFERGSHLLFAAAKRGRTEMVQLLQQEKYKHLVHHDTDMLEPTQAACEYQFPETLRALIPFAPRKILIQRYYTCMNYYSFACFEVLLQEQVPCSSVQHKEYPIMQAVREYDKTFLLLMVKYQPKVVWVPYSDGSSILSYVAARGQMEIMEMLYETQIKGKDLSKEAAIVNAMEMGHAAFARELMQFGFLPQVKNVQLNSVMHWVKTLEDAEFYYNIVKEHGTTVNDLNAKLESPLMLAAFRGSLQVVEFLLAHGANINYAIPSNGATALTYALKESKNEVLVKLLLEHKANTDVLFCQGTWTYPIMYVATENLNKMLAVLLEHGVNPNVQTNNGKCALSSTSSPECRRLLLQYGAKWNISASEAQHVIKELLKDDTQLDLLESWMNYGIHLIHASMPPSIHLAVYWNLFHELLKRCALPICAPNAWQNPFMC